MHEGEYGVNCATAPEAGAANPRAIPGKQPDSAQRPGLVSYSPHA